MIELLYKRRSIRKFAARRVEQEKIDILSKAALLSPSSRNINPWEFIIVDDRDVLAQLSEAKSHGSSFLKDAPLAFVVLADEQKSDVWIEDTSIASIILQLTAESLGLGSCWVQIRHRMHSDAVSAEMFIQEILRIPKNRRIASIIAFGYPDEIREPHQESELMYSKIFSDYYGGRHK